MKIQKKHFNVFYYFFILTSYLIDRKTLSFLRDNRAVNEIFHPFSFINIFTIIMILAILIPAILIILGG